MPCRSSRRYGLLSRFFRRGGRGHRLFERCDLDLVLGIGCAYVHHCLLELVADAKRVSFIGNSRQKLQSEPDDSCTAISTSGLDENMHPDDRWCMSDSAPRLTGREPTNA